MRVKAVRLSLGIGRMPAYECTVYVSPGPEYTLGIDVLQALWLHTTTEEFHLRVRTVTAILRGHAEHSPIQLPPSRQVTVAK